MDNLLDFYINVNNKNTKEGRIPSFKIRVDKETGLITVSYMNGGIDFTDERARMARGLTLTKDGDIVLRGFSKFFNYKQLEDYGMYSEDFKDRHSRFNVEDGKEMTFIEKMDGSLIILGEYNNQLITSTTSSMDNDIALRAKRYFNQRENHLELKDFLRDHNLCACFEWIGPMNQVVVKYNQEEYVLLALINKTTGERHQKDLVYKEFARRFNLKQPKEYKYKLSEIEKILKEEKGIEGFVIENDYGNLIKFKTEEWFELSKVFNIFFSGKVTKALITSVVDAYVEDNLDDLYGFSEYVSKVVKHIITPIDDIIEEARKEYLKYMGKVEDIGEDEVRKCIGKEIKNPMVKIMLFNKVNQGEYLNNKNKTSLIKYLIEYEKEYPFEYKREE